MAAVFIPAPEGLYDLVVDGRAREYDVEPDDFAGAVRRARLDPKDVLIEDDTGYRAPAFRT
jgi:hypothetical protein